ncbi:MULTISPECIES: hypothetical protein [Streptococcus]|uniref:hypothetical protein n=1 Tax=Streptococcus TaxID=1301 RepID=UPI000789C13F|nr:hypothetical protein [Streptococcus parauberis]KYP19812.1 hypothetical protein TN39_01117 [Streptococcus parauberis]KYP19908.1 hypothetical protein AKL14_00712 [Streptococcus parauberis]KYP22773.1 hypothetical protein AKL13_00096 [Streptococcus parauberis]KYP24069.1 hypothetical protein TP84_01800 [Streptococcus parauberis]KYP25283.1 hypothetical protein TM50_01500 [Streptococcus parauberis]
MSDEKIVDELASLLRVVKEYEDDVLKIKNINSKIEEINSEKLNELKKFDEEYLNKYIRENLGEAPKPLKKINPKKLIKKYSEKNEKDIIDYNQNKEQVIKQYYNVFNSQRMEIEEQARQERLAILDQLNTEIKILDQKIEEIELELSKIDYIPEQLLKSDVISQLITYFELKRVDSIKEAINIFFYEFEMKKISEDFEERINSLEEKIDDYYDLISEQTDDNFNQIVEVVEDLRNESNT